MKKVVFSLVACLFLGLIFSPVYGDQLDDINRELEKLKHDLSESQKATKPLEENLNELKQQLSDLKTKIFFIEQDVLKKEKEVKLGEEALSYQKKILNQRTLAFYKDSKKTENSLLNLLVAENLSSSLQNFFYQKILADQDKRTIIKIVLYIKNLEEKKRELEKEKSRLTAIKTDVNKQSQFLAEEVSRAKRYQQELSQKIAELTAKQQELIAKKFAENPIPRSAGTSLSGCTPDYDPLSDQVKKDSGFSPKFGFFSIGVPNKVGMNQYGAYGRAQKGQNYKDILLAYYNNIRFECRNFKDNKIKVQVYEEMNIKDYLKGISEMHRDRTDVYEAFKAQVVAASSYAYAYTNGGEREICSTESCQVYRGKDGRFTLWNQAVDEVNQECGDGVLVMVSNDTNNVITAWYSSTHGGLMLRSDEIGWSGKPWTKHSFDTEGSVNNLRDLLVNAYDGPNFANSPWFYCNWGSRSEYNNTAWLKENEVLEIVNALILFKLDSSILVHLSQIDKNIPDTWDDNKVREEIKNRGGQYFSSISSVEAIWDGSGITHTIIIRGDIGERQYNAQEFKDIFNLRARGNLVILPACLITKSSEIGQCKNYALFDVVKK